MIRAVTLRSWSRRALALTEAISVGRYRKHVTAFVVNVLVVNCPPVTLYTVYVYSSTHSMNTCPPHAASARAGPLSVLFQVLVVCGRSGGPSFVTATNAMDWSFRLSFGVGPLLLLSFPPFLCWAHLGVGWHKALVRPPPQSVHFWHTCNGRCGKQCG